jgi:hypothetical protein
VAVEDKASDYKSGYFIRLIIFSVGRGSCTLISFPPKDQNSPRRYGVIDCNDSQASGIRAYLRKPWFEHESPSNYPIQFEFVAITHYDFDHFNGIGTLLGANEDGLRAAYFLYPYLPPAFALPSKGEKGSEGLKAKQLTEIHRLTFSDEATVTPRPINLGSIHGEVFQRQLDQTSGIFELIGLAPSPKAVDELVRYVSSRVPNRVANRAVVDVGRPNLYSAAIRLRYGDCAAILAGDVIGDEWRLIRADLERNGRLTWLAGDLVLAPHHGGVGNGIEFWEIASRKSPYYSIPEESGSRKATYAILSCGSGDQRLPSADTIDILNRVAATIRCTAPNYHCQKEHSGLGQAPPCSSKIYKASRPIANLPAKIRYKDGHIDLPQKLRFIPDMERTICIDIFKSGESICRFHSRGRCKSGARDIEN